MRQEPQCPIEFSPPFYLPEETQDRRSLRAATILAVLVHAVLFAITFPEFVQDVAEARSAQVFVVRPVPFEPPIDRRQTLPPERSRRVPIPDPTPDDPEPLLSPLPETPALDLPSNLVGIDFLVPPSPLVEQGPVEFRSEMVRPVRISGVDPHYTEIARRARLEGVVILRAVISRQGEVRDLEIVKPLGLGLEAAAMEAVREWRFEPATLDGEPVDVIYRVTVRFRLR